MVRQMGSEVPIYHTRTLGSGRGMGTMTDEAVGEAEAEVRIGEEGAVGALPPRIRAAGTRRGRWVEMNGSMLPRVFTSCPTN